nr:SAM-dependent methyltransferase [uncultured Methanoregula sp.]
MRVRRVPVQGLNAINNADWVDHTRRPYIEDGTAWVPVKEGERFDTDIPKRSRYHGRGYYMVGDIAVVHGKRPEPSEIEKIAEFRNPQGIVWIESLNDVMRLPKTHLVWGKGGEVSHRESGFTYILDPSRVMFSQGNREEKMRMASLIRKSGPNHRVADMFAGIGYFTIPMAGAGASVHAMEINPVSFRYLERNILMNNLSGRVQPSLGDCRSLLEGTYDRLVMGHFDAIDILPDIMTHIKPGSIIHLHSIGPVEEAIRSIIEGAGFSATINVHKVKKYRPHTWHVVQDVTIG